MSLAPLHDALASPLPDTFDAPYAACPLLPALLQESVVSGLKSLDVLLSWVTRAKGGKEVMRQAIDALRVGVGQGGAVGAAGQGCDVGEFWTPSGPQSSKRGTTSAFLHHKAWWARKSRGAQNMTGNTRIRWCHM